MSSQLTQPIHPSRPAGEDVTGMILQLEQMLRYDQSEASKETEPNWMEIDKLVRSVLQRSKHVSAYVIFILVSMRFSGLPGFTDGLEILSRNVCEYWDHLYPRDPEDPTDLSERFNALGNLLTPPHSNGDDYCFLARLQAMPLCKLTGFGVVTLATLGTKQLLEGVLESLSAQEKAAILLEIHAPAQRALSAVQSMEAFLLATNAANRPNWEPLSTLLQRLHDFTISLSPQPEVSQPTAPGPSQAAVSSQAVVMTPPAQAGAGVINSPEDVMRTLDNLCAYYRRAEPSSPIPLLLQRCKILVSKSFLDILEEIQPEALAEIKKLAGIREAKPNQS